MCMKEQYMFPTVILPYPRNPKDKLDVYLQPSISELQALWEIRVETYDISRKEILCYRHLSYGQLVTFQLTQCCPVGVHLADYHVRILWMNKMFLPYKMEGNKLGLIIIITSFH